MAQRNPFAFLDDESPNRRIMLLLLALIRKSGGSVSLSLDDITSVEDGASFHKEPDDKGTSLVLRFARRGAEAYFLPATEDPSQIKPSRLAQRSSSQSSPTGDTLLPSSPRHAVHDDLDLAMREEEMAQRSQTAQRERLQQARADAGEMPWRTKPV